MLAVAMMAAAFATFALVFRWLAVRPRQQRWWYAALATVLALPGALFAVYYLRVLPEMAWYYELRSWPGSELLLLPLGAAGAAWAALLPRRLLVLPLLAAGVAAAVPFLKPLMWPLATESLADQWQGDICIQSTPATCGPASAATILRTLGLDADEATLAHDARSSATGTEAWYLARALRARGVTARFRITDDFDPDGPLPAIIGVRLRGGSGHFIAVLGRAGEAFVIGDPLDGRKTLPLERLRRRYTLTGFRMHLTR